MEKNIKTKQIKKTGRSYSSRFLKRNSLKNRGDKTIYVRSEYHEKLTRILQVAGAGEIPLYTYLDNILKDHFEQYSEQITEDYNKNIKPIF